MVIQYLSFWGTAILFPTEALPFYLPTSNKQKFRFFHIITNTCCFQCFVVVFNALLLLFVVFIIILMNVKWYLILVLVRVSLSFPNTISNIEHLFMCLLAIYVSTLEKYLFKFAVLLLNETYLQPLIQNQVNIFF